MDEDRHEPWWLNVKVKLKLSRIYKTKGMLEAFVEVIHPIVRESIKNDSVHQKVLFKKFLCSLVSLTQSPDMQMYTPIRQ